MPPLPSFADMLARANGLVTAITLAMATPGSAATEHCELDRRADRDRG
jgi:hypothetical protein